MSGGAHARAADAGAPDGAVAALLAPVRDVTVWPGCRHALCAAEAVVVASPPFQRLHRLRQMGLAFHAFPAADNSRAAHSLGVAYWSARILHELGAPPPAAGGLSPALVVRLFALLHDIDLLPLGHTLRYQSSMLAEAPGRPRLAACVAGIRAHVAEHGLPTAAGGTRGALLAAFDRHLLAAAAARPGSDEPAGALAAEIVNAMLGADLLDFALRDSFAIGRPQAVPADHVTALRLVTHRGRARLAIAAAQADRADDLYRARFELFAGSVYHPRKLAADAMLDAIVRRIEAAAPDPRWRDARLLALGDDAFLDLVTALEPVPAGGIPLAPALNAGRLHEEVFRTTDLAAFRALPGTAEALALVPRWRDRAEAALLAALPGAQAGDVIVAVSPERMQAKPPDVPLLAADGTVRPLADAPGSRARETAAAYGALWSLRVYLAPRRRALAADVARLARVRFAGGAAPW